MKQKVLKSARLKEQYVIAEHESGLKVCICPKPELTSTYALFGTKYGSIDTKFRLKGEPDFTEVPEGIAHFLEHKLFESEDGDAFTRFSKTGAFANAYTSFDRTCYLFSCTERFDENLDILLDFVRHPYFTEETVQKEQGIIGQEIRMYDDDPGWSVMFNLLCALFKNHPVRIDIAGTVESISHINAELLYKCYNTFYNPSNMFVCIAGPVEPDNILEKIETVFKDAKGKEIERGGFDEPRDILESRVERSMAVAQPLFNFGYKENCGDSMPSLRERIETAILLEILAGKSSRLYNEMLDNGLINDSFDAQYFTGYGYAVEIFEGESNNPDAAISAIKTEIARLRADGIDNDEFLRAKNSLYGRNVMLYNSVERIASALVGTAMFDDGLFDIDEIYNVITRQDLEKRLNEQFDERYSALSIIVPDKN